LAARLRQRWVRHIDEAFPDLDGLHYNSRFAGGSCVVLFRPASNSKPPRPVLSLPLTYPGLALRIASASQRLGYLVIEHRRQL
jgi:hypothetical protein